MGRPALQGYPVNLLVAGRRCVVVGGGRIAARKIAALLDAGATVHVVAPDLRGHGHSDWEPPWDLDAHLGDILASVPDAPGVWIGHSFGGRLAAELARREPGRVERLALLDPALQVLPHVAFDLAELERADASYESVEQAVQARYDAGRVLLAPKELVLESDGKHLEAGTDGRLRYRYCKSAVIAALRPTISMPKAVQFIPEACRHMSSSGTSWKMVPSVSITKWEHVPGSSPRSGALEAKVFHTTWNVSVAVKCSTTAWGWLKSGVSSP